MKALLKKLQLKSINAGACYGPNGWLAEAGGPTLISYNPATGEPIAKVQQATAKTYEAVVSKATASFETWRMMPAPKRGEVVRQLGNALRELKEPLGELVTLEMGKIKAEGIGEVQEMIDICDFAVGLSRQLYGLTTHSERPGHRMYEQWHPLGPVGIITAFNFPTAVWSWNAAIAAVCGDTMVWKPSPLTPLTAIATQHICNRVMADFGLEGVFTLMIGSNEEVGERLINDPRLPLVSFTGSIRTGRHVAEAVARRLGRSVLELGGNNGIIVTEDADLKLATRAIVFGSVGTAGQRCTSTRRIIMHKSVAKDLTARLLKAYKQVPIGNPLEDGVLMGPLVNERAVENMLAALETVKAQGGEVLTGGRRLPKLGACYVEPTIVKVKQQLPIVCDETFAPILYLMEYETLDEALALHNAVPQGLSSAIFTTNLLKAEQ
ncbi:MAG: aldehyde dehydrogenase family protein, partial [Anaerolineales bacterium]|nr:aldehyde dehydrogenase family protein [Anaerolineales bacterium]